MTLQQQFLSSLSSPSFPAPSSRCAVEVDPRTRTISVAGELDCASAPLLIRAGRELARQPGQIVIDLVGTRFVDAAGLGAVVEIGNALSAGGTRVVADRPVVVRGAGGEPRRAFVTGGLACLLAG